MKRFAPIGFVLLFLVPGRQLIAQSAGGTVSGTITDPGGAVVAGAAVEIVNSGTSETRKVATSVSGFYTAPNLASGTYSISVALPGFAGLVRNGLTVSVGSEIVVNLQLRLGETSEKVEVKGDSPVVETGSSQTGAVVGGQTIRELPLNGRDWTTLAALEPGVSQVRTQQTVGLSIVRANRGLGSQMTIGGNRPQQNNYRLDGISVNDYAGGGPASVLGTSLGVDSIQEFSVVTSNATADYGKSSGGAINAITRAGNNGFHGSAYEFLRNSALDARNFFDPGVAPPFKRNQFGGSLGGPVVHDRTFFFVDYEGFRQALGVSNVDNVPTASARAGKLQAGAVTVNPKVIPYLALYPTPNGVVAGDIGTYLYSSQQHSTEDLITARIDHRFSNADSIHGSFLIDNGKLTGPDAFNDVVLGTNSHRKFASVEETHLISPTMINFLRAGVNRTVVSAVETIEALNPLVADTALGFIPGHAVGQINVTGLTNFQGGLGATGDYQFHYSSYQAYDDLFWTKGNHALKFGIAGERVFSSGLAGGSPNGMATFGSLSNFLTNKPTTFTANIPGTDNPVGFRQTVFGLYVQDDWRLRPNLTLNLGLRYELSTVPTEQHNRLTTLATLTSPAPRLGSPLFTNPTGRAVSPRVGFAWDPFRTGKTSIRGAFGMYDSLPLLYEMLLVQLLSQPYFEQGSSAALAAGSFPNGMFSTLSASSLRTAYIEQNPKRNYVMQWNFNLQRQLMTDLSLEVGYSGSHGVHSPFLSTDVNIVLPTVTAQGYVWPAIRGSGTRINTNVGAISPLVWQVSSVYDALQVRLRKRLSHGFQIQGAYTFAKSLDTGSASVQTAFTNTVSSLPLFDPKLRRGPSDFDVRHNLVLSQLYELPGLRSGIKALDWVEKGWQFGVILQASAGLPFTPFIGGDALGLNSSNPFNFPDRLNLPGCGTPVNPGNPAHYIKTECFAAPTPGTRLGNSGRNVAFGPGLFNMDTSLVRNFRAPRVSEAFNVQFRAELFNVLNHVNFSPPNTANTQVFNQNLAPLTTAGTLTTTSTTSRQIQFGLKLVF